MSQSESATSLKVKDITVTFMIIDSNSTLVVALMGIYFDMSNCEFITI